MSAIPDVIDALVAAWTAANITLTIDGTAYALQVSDGPLWDVSVDYLAVGWDKSDQPGITGDGVDTDLAGEVEAETFDVSCLLSSWYGGADRPLSAVRRAQFDALKALRAALDGLVVGPGSVCDTATVRAREVSVAQVEGGVSSDLRFDVNVTAYGV